MSVDMVTSLTSLSSEVILRILGSLEDARDVVRIRQVSRRLYNIGGDALLWRDLFVHTYLRSESTTSRQKPSAKRRKVSHSTEACQDDVAGNASLPVRVIKDLPMMQEFNASSSNRKDSDDRRVDWYTLFKVSRNWQTGNFSSRQLQTLQSRGRDPDVKARPSKVSFSNTDNISHYFSQTLIESTSSHIFASMQSQDRHADSPPVLLVFPSSCREGISSGERSQEALAQYQAPTSILQKQEQLRITSLAVDKGPKQGTSVRLFVAYSSGKADLLNYNTVSNTFHDNLHFNNDTTDTIVSASLHSTMLATCTNDFKIRFYDTSNNSIRLIEERRSYSCHWPASLRLEPLGSQEVSPRYKLSIAYSVPVYPLGWTVGLQEMIVGMQSSMQSRSASARRAHVITQLDSPSKEDKRRLLLGFGQSLQERREQVGRLTSLSYEHPFIVVGTKDNNVVCFRVAGSIRKENNISEPAAALELSHVCTFQGHTGTVHSVSLNEGRCVTGGSDGSVRVWRLGDEEASVAKAAGLLTTIDASLRRGFGKVVTIGATLASAKGKREPREVQPSGPLSLADILCEARNASGSATGPSSSSAVVRLVTSAFDHIISVSAVKTSTAKVIAPSGSTTCRAEHNIDREEEQVQIWNFAK